jgi:hypothetical protein
MCLRIKALDKGEMVLNDVERLDLLGRFRQGSFACQCAALTDESNVVKIASMRLCESGLFFCGCVVT